MLQCRTPCLRSKGGITRLPVRTGWSSFWSLRIALDFKQHLISYRYDCNFKEISAFRTAPKRFEAFLRSLSFNRRRVSGVRNSQFSLFVSWGQWENRQKNRQRNEGLKVKEDALKGEFETRVVFLIDVFKRWTLRELAVVRSEASHVTCSFVSHLGDTKKVITTIFIAPKAAYTVLSEKRGDVKRYLLL